MMDKTPSAYEQVMILLERAGRLRRMKIAGDDFGGDHSSRLRKAFIDRRFDSHQIKALVENSPKTVADVFNREHEFDMTKQLVDSAFDPVEKTVAELALYQNRPVSDLGEQERKDFLSMMMKTRLYMKDIEKNYALMLGSAEYPLLAEYRSIAQDLWTLRSRLGEELGIPLSADEDCEWRSLFAEAVRETGNDSGVEHIRLDREGWRPNSP